MPANNTELEKRLWAAADELRANSNLTASQYSAPVLGLIFLRYADARFTHAQADLEGKATGRKKITKIDYQAQGVMYLPETARFSALVNLPEGENIGKAINDAMTAVEEENEDLRGVLPKTYNRLDNRVLFELLKIFNAIPMDIEGDAFGKIYEYFLGKFALSEGQRGGEFFTPTSLVKLIVEIIEPYHGYILDPACGSGGMFVQSAEFVRRHKGSESAISLYGQERVEETVRLCRMNLAVHGLHGDIRQGNSYYEDVHDATGRFDFVMANPPFNVNGVDKEKIKDDRQRYPLGMPNPDNGNYLWIQLFYSALNATGRAGFVMANSASDARQSELELRKQLIQSGAVDAIVAVGPNFFYNVTLPVTLWFLDKGKQGTPREDQVLFLDARSVFTQVDRAHREFTPEQVGMLASIVRLYRGEDLNGFVFDRGNYALPEPQLGVLETAFTNRQYTDIAGLCKVMERESIEDQGWSLNPGRYVGVIEKQHDEWDFSERLEELNEELEQLNSEAHTLEAIIADNFVTLLEN
ncbi:MAG: class I SAM-dependent DNA methyltransferase [Anaerolineaceae bacterium]|nr:class I SAM-dependent DNA methyltransferase [Anaerolineaceae bacterium]